MQILKHGVVGLIPPNTNCLEFKEALISLFRFGCYYPKAMLALVQRARTEVANGSLHLSHKEIHHLTLFYSAKSYKEIAEILFVDVRTIHDYRDRLFDKLKLEKRTREGLILKAVQMALAPYKEL